jgi:hypothetical protein
VAVTLLNGLAAPLTDECRHDGLLHTVSAASQSQQSGDANGERYSLSWRSK